MLMMTRLWKATIAHSIQFPTSVLECWVSLLWRFARQQPVGPVSCSPLEIISMDWVVYLDSSQILQSHQMWNTVPSKRRESKVATHGVSETKGETRPSVSLRYMIFAIFLHSWHPFRCILTCLSVHICTSMWLTITILFFFIPPDFLHASFLS